MFDTKVSRIQAQFLVVFLVLALALVLATPAAATATSAMPPTDGLTQEPQTLPEMLGQIAQQLTVAFFLALVNERLVAALIAPVKQKWPNLDGWWLIYPSWVLGGLIVFASGINLFSPFLPDPMIGKVLTAVVGGGGANLLHDIFYPKTQ